MRLHRLEMTAFQPFAATEAVDFESLSDAGLFLMQGETGAGKTAILDAICFALFGHVPGVRDGASRLRSDHSAPSDRTQVSLELTLGGRRLRVIRSPKQERPKLRGEGTTEEPAKATLEVRGHDGEWTVLEERIEGVEHELHTLLGLNLSQFSQVVLLPQGAFARFLHASNDDRERILEQLFGTDRYAAAEAWLSERLKAAEASVRQGLEAVSDAVSRIAHVAGEEPPEDWRDEPELIHEWLQNRAVGAEADEAAAAGRRDAALRERDAAAAARDQAVSLGERQRRHERALKRLAELTARLPERHRDEQRRAAARRAETVLPLARSATRAEREAADAEAMARQALGAAQGRLPECVELSAEAAAQADERACELREQAGEAGTLLEAESALEADRERLASLEQELRLTEAQAVERRAWCEQATSKEQTLVEAVQVAQAAQAGLPGLREAAAAADARARAGVRRDALEAELVTARSDVSVARDEELAARQAWLDAREQRLKGIAAELAGELIDGRACRVCGALEHPAPASHGDGGHVDAEAERALQQALEHVASTHLRARERQAGLERELAAAEAVCGDAGTAELQARHRAAAESAEQQALVAQDLPQAEFGLSAHRQQRSAHEREVATLNERLAELRGELGRGHQALRQVRDQVNKARGGCESINARLVALEASATAWSAAARAVERSRDADRRAHEAREGAEAAASACGFGSLTEAMDAALGEEQAEELEAAIADFDAQMERLKGVSEDPELVQAAAEPPPDEAGAETALQACEEELRQAQRAHALADRAVRELHSLSRQLDARLQDLAPLLAHRQLVRSVAGLVDGSSPANRLRMPLPAYVLAARLEQIAHAASRRLSRMSGGRYVLVHCDERIGRGRKAGLGLAVIDGWTGRERPPASLSGGETFQASLALALGLADVVAAESGGARLETLFVDEGFGSLGDRALDDVLDVLDGLRDGGRAVGVISHVAEMRQRIPVQLHVEKRRDGSRIRQR